MKRIRALTFDIQGTTVDFYKPMLRMGDAFNARTGSAIDWAALSRAWRALYREKMDAIIGGKSQWIRVDRIYREALDVLLAQEGLADHVPLAERDAINEIWTRLDPWPDSVAGLTRLRQRFILSTLSNAGMAAVVGLVKHAALPFDAILTAELARSYKPAPAVYQLAVDLFGIPAEDILMVACHKYDLHAAKGFGMRTAFVARPLEFGPDDAADCTPDLAFDINARDFLDLADQLGA